MSLALNKISASHWQLQGRLNVNTITAIIAPGYRMIDGVPAGETLTVDLSGVEQVDSASVALLIDWLRYAKKQGKSLNISHPPEKMKDIIHVSNLDGVL